jgi:hypothetical protein
LWPSTREPRRRREKRYVLSRNAGRVRLWFKAQDQFQKLDTAIHTASYKSPLAPEVRNRMDAGAYIINDDGFFQTNFTDMSAADWTGSVVDRALTDQLRRDR